ncbi:MAG: S8 family serine peptidase [Phycisphaera sp.]|nr:MAG: S8 family serine peptidase [Phycisphaera sp.]
MQRGTTRWTVVAASAAVLLASSGLALASQSLAKPTQTQTVRVGDGYVRTWIDAGQPMVAISLDGFAEQRVVEQRGTVMLRYAEFDPAGVIPAVPQNLQAIGGNRAFIVQYISQPLEAYGDAIARLGGTVERFLPDQAQIVTIDADMVDDVRALPFVRWVGAYHPAYKLDDPELQRLTLGSAGDAPVYQRYSIQTLRRGDGSLDGLAQQVREMGAPIDLESHPVGRLEAWLTDDQVLAVAQRSDVLFMDFRGEPELDVDIARMIGGADYIESVAGFSGEGVRAEVMDSGLFTGHQEFSSMSPAPLLHGSVISASHGTSVFSIVFAPGVNPQARGFLPDAEQTIAAGYPALGDRYAHTARLVDPTGPYRAVFQTNSWGGPRTTAYETVSAEMDDILFDHDIIITQSQSNSGSTPSRPQAWAKNIVAVGGINHFGTLDRSDDRHGGSAGSTGPAADGRIKPDLSHFYDSTIAATTGAPTSYTQFGGTSGATPITAGHFGLFFQMWNEGVFGPVAVPGGTVFENRPVSSTAKAFMINTGLMYDFTGPSGDLNRMRQGWGLADVGKLYDERERFFIVDANEPVSPLGANSYPLKVASDEPDLRVTMVYRDPSGTTSATKHRINDLTLKVTSPSGDVYYGNNGLTNGNESTPGGSPNDIDNVENVFVTSPEGGVWTVEVSGDEINQDGNPATPELDAVYSLVVAGVTPAIGMSLVSDVPDIVLPGTQVDVQIEVIEGDEMLDGTPQIYYDMTGSGFTQADMTLNGDTWEFQLPAAACGTTPAFYTEVTGDGGTTVTLPALGADGPYDIDRVGEDLDFGTFDFETPAGWMASGTPATGDWAVATPDGVRGAPDADFDGSGQAFVTGADVEEDVDGGPTILTSPMFQLAGAPDGTELRYARWFYNDDQRAGRADADRLTVEITDGSGWETLEIIDHDIAGEEWGEVVITVADHVSLTNQVQLRFSVTDSPNDSRTEAAVDAASVTGFRCGDSCRADLDGDGDLTIFDFLEFQNLFSSGDLRADFDGDGSLNIFDFLAFQNEFAAGCP